MNRAQRRREVRRARKGTLPGDLEAAIEGGLEHHRSGRLAEAKSAYEQVLRRDPVNARALFLLGTLAAQERDFGTAERLIRRAIEGNPEEAAYRNNLGVILREAGQLEEAVSAYREAIELQPDYTEAHGNLGVALKDLGRAEEALAPLERAIELSPDFAGAHSNLGNALHELGCWEEARAAFDRAATLAPTDPSVYFNRAVALQDLGDLDAARKDLRTVLRLQPKHGEAWRLLTGLTRYESLEDEDIKAMSRLVQDAPEGGRDAMHLHFGLGKSLEDAGEPDDAFAHYAEANRIYRGTYDYDIEKDAAYFASIKRVFSAEFLSERAGWGYESRRPILIVGMMRSGTSLVEQILASHPQVSAGGELKELDRLVRQKEAALDDVEYPESVPTFADTAVRELGETYVEALVSHAGDAERLTDKMPGNFLYVGLVRLLLPHATVVHCVRDPVDTCLSCYRNYFSGLHPYAYDLAELGRYFGLYRDLMDHWRDIAPGFVHDIRYEELVADPESQIRNLLAICGLKWDDRCLEFHRTKRPVRTASAAQVRQPMYRTSVAAWGKFEKHLGPLMDSLQLAQ